MIYINILSIYVNHVTIALDYCQSPHYACYSPSSKVNELQGMRRKEDHLVTPATGALVHRNVCQCR